MTVLYRVLKSFDRSELVDSFWFVDFRHEADKGCVPILGNFPCHKNLLDATDEGGPHNVPVPLEEDQVKTVGGPSTLVGLNENKASLTSPSVTSLEIESRM